MTNPEIRIVTVGGVPMGTMNESGVYTPAVQAPSEQRLPKLYSGNPAKDGGILTARDPHG